MTPRVPLGARPSVLLTAALLMLTVLGGAAWAQYIPPQPLPYTQDFSALPWSSSTFPSGWDGWKSVSAPGSSFDINPPGGMDPLKSWSDASNTTPAIHNYDGKVGILDDPYAAGRQLALAIDCTGRSNVQVRFDIMTIRNPYDGAANTRINEAILQYRIGTGGPFTNLYGTEYQNNTTQQVSGTTPQNPQSRTVALPPACDNQSNVQLRWVDRLVSGSGQYPSFAVDIVSVTTLTMPTVDGVIHPGEYGTHVDGQNQQTTAGQIWYMTWDQNYLYVGISNANVYEGAVLYLDRNPVTPVNGGSDADGNLTGFNYDNTSFSSLQFRADLVVYFKQGYAEARLAGGGSWLGAVPISSYATNGSNVREIAIPWSHVGGRPATFDWFGYVTSPGGWVYGPAPPENPAGSIGAGARWERYYTVSDATPGTGTKPFNRNSFLRNDPSVGSIGVLSAYDFTLNDPALTAVRSGGAWNIGGNLRVERSSLKFMNAPEPLIVAGDVYVGAAGALDFSGGSGSDIQVGGNWTMAGLVYGGLREVIFNGTAAQTISGNSVYFSTLVIQNAVGVTLQNDISVNSLSLGPNRILTGNYRVSLLGGGTLSRTSGYIAGALERKIDPGSVVDVTYDVGDATNYTPVDFHFSSVTTGNYLVVRPTATEHPNIGSSSINPAKSVNRYWSITNGMGGPLVFGNCDALFRFVPTDLDPGANYNNFAVGRYSGGTWTYPTVISRMPDGTRVAGLTGFSDFAIGETSCGAITIVPPTLLNGVRNVPYSQTLTASGGAPSYTFTWTGSPPPGLSLSPGGVISGTPLSAGTYSFTVNVTDAGGCPGSQPYTMNIIVPDYTWVGGGDVPWTTPSNWSPPRNFPSSLDILRFTATGGIKVLGVPTQTVAQLAVDGSSAVTLQAGAPGDRLTVGGGGGGGGGLQVAAGGSLNVSGMNRLDLFIGSGATAIIEGDMEFVDAPHTLDAADPGAIRFGSTASLRQMTGCAGNIFTNSGTPNAVRFMSGSSFVSMAGLDPFALPPPSSKVVFEEGSRFKHQQSGAPSFDRRAYGDFVLETSGPVVATANDASVRHLTIQQGELILHLGATGCRVRGDIQLGTSSKLTCDGGGQIELVGSAPQIIGSGGQADFTGAILKIASTSGWGVTVQRDLTVARLVLSTGLITIQPTFTLTVNESVLRFGGWVNGNLRRYIPGGGPTSSSFDIGSANRYAPVMVAFGNVTAGGYLSARTTDGDHPQLGGSSLNLARSVNRYWSLTNSGVGFDQYSATFTFDPADRDVDSDWSRYAVGRYDGGWSYPAVGARTATSTQVVGLASFSDFAIGEPGDVTPPVVHVTAPAGGEVWTIGTSQTITWSATDDAGVATVDLAYSTDGGINYPYSIASGIANSGSYSWTVPNTPSNTARVRATAHDNNGNAGADASDADFIIRPAEVPAVTDLAAVQVKHDNDTDGTTQVELNFTPPVGAYTVEVWRAPFGHYPEYDDAGGTPPAAPAGYPPGAAWTLTPITRTGDRDEIATRDFWYYVAYARDAYDYRSVPSNVTAGTLNYHLGDVRTGADSCAGENLVNTPDVSYLAVHYGVGLGAPGDPLACLDVGPTADYSPDARPLTDNLLDFEDLIVLAMNYRLVSAPPLAAASAPADRDEVVVEAPALVRAGETFTAIVHLKGAGDLQGLSVQLGWDPAVAEPIAVEAGPFVGAQGGVVLSAAPGNVDAALLGSGRALAGEGLLATVTFRAHAAGEPRIGLAALEGRDRQNRKVTVAKSERVVPRATGLMPAAPNPFNVTTTLAFSLAKGGPVELAIYSVDGRRLATLVDEAKEVGVYRLAWDGRDAAGQRVRPGLFFARLATPEGRYMRTLVVLR